jgi:hypothetical protein
MTEGGKTYRAILAIALVLIAVLTGLNTAATLGALGPNEYGVQAVPKTDIDWAVISKLTVNQSADLTGACVDLDDDDDTSVCADTDDQIDIEIGGADDFQFTANSFTILTGSQIATQYGTGEGVLFVAKVATSYAVTTTSSIVIPANADVIDWQFVVTTLYNDSGTDLMNCGTAADADRYVDDLAVSTAGPNRALDAADMQSDELANFGDVGSSALTIQCVYTGQNGDASAGAGMITIWYRLD